MYTASVTRKGRNSRIARIFRDGKLIAEAVFRSEIAASTWIVAMRERVLH